MYRLLFLFSLSASSCASSGTPFQLETFGEMRQVLREGHTEGRVSLTEMTTAGTWGLGALAGLEGEITILDGDVFLETVVDGRLERRAVEESDQAALLVSAWVPEWREVPLGAIASLRELEKAMGEALDTAGFDPARTPVPIRIEGEFSNIALHVLDHSCPIANPDGPPPIRWEGSDVRASIVGIYAVGFGGKLTHHGQTSHLHVVARLEVGDSVSGHLEQIAFVGRASLLIPLSH